MRAGKRFFAGAIDMQRTNVPLCGIGLVLAAAWAAPASAQPSAVAGAPGEIDPASIPLPVLTFEPDDEAERNYHKYFYFHRAETDFATAYADLRECDGYARGFAYDAGNNAVPYPYAFTIAGAIGGAIGNVMADAIFGSAERRRLRRVNMRTCMTFKGYGTYGLPKALWEEFNFEEGNRTVAEEERQRLLQLQARVASGPVPQVGEMVE